MSIYPCEVCGTVASGSLDGFYIRMRQEDTTWFRKVRLCRRHAIEFLETHEKQLRRVHPMYGITFLSECGRCGHFVDLNNGACRLFMDVYLKGDERVSYVATFCTECAVSICDALELAVENKDAQLHETLHASVQGGQPTGRNGRYQREGRDVVYRGRVRENDPKAPDDH